MMNSPKFAPFLTFAGKAEEAMNFYVNILPGAKMESIVRYEKGMPGDEGKVMSGILSFQGQEIIFMDMAAEYECPPFAWSVSLLVTLTDEVAYDAMFDELAKDGFVMMKQEPFMEYRKVAWVTDKYGVTWQPVLAHEADVKPEEVEPEAKKKPAKDTHRWSKAVSEIDFFVDYQGSTATVRWQKRNEMLIKKGARLVAETPLNKDGSVGFAAKFTLQLRDMQADKVKDFVTTEDIILKSVNEVGNFLYFAGTNSWLVLKDQEGKSIHDYTVVN